MDITGIITAVSASGLFAGIAAFFQNRQINRATANATERSTEAEYTKRILEQADERVKQVLADRDRAIADRDYALKERDDAYLEAKAQRKAKQEWREKYSEEEKAHHATQLQLKCTEGLLREADWNKCEVSGCANRMPPRSRTGNRTDKKEKDGKI